MTATNLTMKPLPASSIWSTTLAVIDNRIADVFGVLAKPVKLVTAESIDLLVESVIAGMQRLKALDVKESGESASQEKPTASASASWRKGAQHERRRHCRGCKPAYGLACGCIARRPRRLAGRALPRSLGWRQEERWTQSPRLSPLTGGPKPYQSVMSYEP